MRSNFNKKIIVFIIIFLFFEVSFIEGISASNQIQSTTYQEKTIETDGDDFDEEVMNYMEQGHMPSLSACIIKNNSVLWSKGYGYADIYKGVEATENTIYLAASLTKTITATAVMQLWEQGLFDLDDDVNDYLPFSLRNPNYPDEPITFRMLLAHHSSLSSGEISLYIYFTILRLPIEFLEQYLVPGGLFYSPIYWSDIPPGEQVIYSSIGYEVLGYLVKLLSGQSFDKYCKEHIFEPLAMKKTSFHKNYFDINDLARPYIWILNSTYLPLVNYKDWNYAAGGIRTSVMDLSHFLIATMNGGVYNNYRILEEETIQLMRTRQYPGSYGLGWRISGRYSNNSFGHSGGMPGALAYMYYYLNENTGIIFFTNQYPLVYNYDDIRSYFNIVWLLNQKADEL